MPFVDRCSFTASAAGTADFNVGAPSPGFLTPAVAGAVDASAYSYVAEQRDNAGGILAWEVGTGIWSTGTNTLSRQVVTLSSSSNAKVSFGAPPRVSITLLAADAGPLGINVVQFGADPTGSADSTAAFNAAIAYASGIGGIREVYAEGTFGCGALTDPANPVVLKINGTVNLSATWTLANNISIIGLGGAPLQQFGLPPQARINGIGLSAGNPAIRLIGQARHYLANLLVIPNHTDPAINCDGTTITGTGLGSTASLDNINIFTAGTTNIPLVIDCFFWVWCHRLRINQAGTVAVKITNSDAGASGLSGIIYFDDYIISSGGITITTTFATSTGFIGGIVFRNGSSESLKAGATMFLLDGTIVPCTDITIDGFVLSDSLGGSGLVCNGICSNIRLLGANDLKSQITPGVATEGIYIDGAPSQLFTPLNLPRLATGCAGDFILGALLGIGDTMSPALSPVAPLQLVQDASLWDALAVSQGHGLVVDYGIVAPDGTPTAASVTNPSSTPQGLTLLSYNVTPAIGDIVILGCWMQPTSLSQSPRRSFFAASWVNAGVQFDNRGGLGQNLILGASNPGPADQGLLGNWATKSWIPEVQYASVISTPGGTQTLNIAINHVSTQPVCNIWHPFCFYIPVGILSVDEIGRLFQSLRRGPINGQPGDIALLDHQKLMLGGGVRLDSRSAQPTKYLYNIGDRTFNTTAAGGWTCTASGGASSTTRANTTAYATGVWAAWPSGTTVVECTIIARMNVLGTASGGGGVIVLLVDNVGNAITGETVTVSAVGGTTEANSSWVMTKIDGTHISLNGSTWVNPWTAGGVVRTDGKTAASPPTAPTTVGQLVVDHNLTWTCRSLTTATFSASL
jgi:hypothetical protein